MPNPELHPPRTLRYPVRSSPRESGSVVGYALPVSKPFFACFRGQIRRRWVLSTRPMMVSISLDNQSPPKTAHNDGRLTVKPVSAIRYRPPSTGSRDKTRLSSQ